MRIIDDRGRLFGKVNLLDFLVIIFLFFLLPMFYFGYRLSAKASQLPVDMHRIETEFNCEFLKMSADNLKLVKVGDKELDNTGNEIGQVTWIDQPEPFKWIFAFTGQARREECSIIDPTLTMLRVKLKLKGVIVNNKFYYNGQDIFSDGTFNFKTKYYKVQAKVLLPEEEVWKEIKVRFSGVLPEINKVISEGHLERNSDGKIIGKLSGILSSNPSQVSALKLEENKFIFVNDPFRNDIIASLDILCTKEDNYLYFKNYPVKIGSQITFSSDLYVITGTIIDIKG